MMPSHVRWIATASLALLVGMSGALLSLQPIDSRSYAAMAVAQTRADPPKFEAGAPLSELALTPRPKAIRGLLSWTLESRLHRGHVNTFVVSPDGKLIATAGFDGMIRIWELESGTLVRVLVGHGWTVDDLAWSRDGHTLASAGGYDCTVRVWDTRSGRALRVFRNLKDRVDCVAWSPDGKRLIAAGSDSGWVWSYDAKVEQAENLLNLGKEVHSIAWSPDGNSVAFGCKDIGVKLMSASKDKIVGSLGPGNEDAQDVAWAPNGQSLVACGSTVTRCWDVATGKERFTIPGQSSCVAYSPTGKKLATCSPTSSVSLWEPESGKPITTIADSASIVAWSSSQELLITLRAHSLAVRNTDNGKAHAIRIASDTSVVWSAGKPLVTGKGTKTLTLWDAAACKSVQALEHPDKVRLWSWSRDGKTLAAAVDKNIHLWDTKTGKEERKLEGHDGAVTALAWSPDGKTLASGGEDKKAVLWEVATGQASARLEGHTGVVTAVVWAPNGATLVTGSADRNLRLWAVSSGKMLRTLREATEVRALAWSSDGTTLASGGAEPVVRLWQTNSGKLLKQLEDKETTYWPPEISRLAWSPNGTLLAVGRRNWTLQVWNPTGKLLHRVKESGEVESLGWSPNGSTVASGTPSAVRFWDTTRGELRAALVHENDHLIAMSADGHYYAEPGGENELVYVAQTRDSQETLAPAEFAGKYKWKNNPASVKLSGN